MSSTASRLDIYNMALGFIGSRTVGSPNEQTNEAIQCELYWDRARRAALRDFPYNFSVQRIQLASKAVPDVYCSKRVLSDGSTFLEPVTWRNCYAWPQKTLRLLGISSLHASAFPTRDYRVETYGREKVILTNVPEAQADVIIDQDDISLWDELFVNAMARKLACLIAVPILKNNQQKLKELEELYQGAVPRTDGINSSEHREHERPDTWLLARSEWRFA